jgi:hypothetical protein
MVLPSYRRSVVTRVIRPQHHYSFIQRVQRRRGTARNWTRRIQQLALDALPWQEESKSTSTNFQYDSNLAEEIISRLDPLEYYHRFSTLQVKAVQGYKSMYRLLYFTLPFRLIYPGSLVKSE